MKITKELAVMLGLSKDEVLVLSSLSDTTLRTSDVQHLVNIPRTTVERLLQGLHKRRLVAKHKFSERRGGWRAVDIKSLLSTVCEDNGSNDEVAYPVQHVSGFAAMRKFEYELLQRCKNKKYFGIQGVRAWRAFHSTFSINEAHVINEMLVKNNILADVIISEETDKELLRRAYFDRPSLAHSVPDKFLPTAFDIEITLDEVVVMNWEEKRAISIKDKEIAKLFIGIFEFMKESSRYFNVYKEIDSVK